MLVGIILKRSASVNLYITKPQKENAKADAAVLYLTDVFGIQLPENKLYVALKRPKDLTENQSEAPC